MTWRSLFVCKSAASSALTALSSKTFGTRSVEISLPIAATLFAPFEAGTLRDAKCAFGSKIDENFGGRYVPIFSAAFAPMFWEVRLKIAAIDLLEVSMMGSTLSRDSVALSEAADEDDLLAFGFLETPSPVSSSISSSEDSFFNTIFFAGPALLS